VLKSLLARINANLHQSPPSKEVGPKSFVFVRIMDLVRHEVLLLTTTESALRLKEYDLLRFFRSAVDAC